MLFTNDYFCIQLINFTIKIIASDTNEITMIFFTVLWVIVFAKLIIILMSENKYDLKCETQFFFIKNDYILGKLIFFLIFIISGC